MTSEGQERLLRRCTSLGVGELTAAAVFAVVAGSRVLPVIESRRDALALWSALVPLLAILVQPGVYWLLSRSWAGRTRMPAGIAAGYRAFRMLDPILLVLGLIGVLVWFPTGAGAVLVVGIWLFGVVEYLNYFVIRLAYPVRHWPARVAQRRTPRLIKDIRRSE